MSKDMEAIGPVALYFYASIDTDDTNWIVELRDVGGDGSEQIVAKGYLRASHRALDESKSKPLQPYHPHTGSQPVVPNEIYEYAIEMAPIAAVFRAGHRIELIIKSMESPREPEMLTHFHPTLPSSRRTLHTIYRDKMHPSYLLLPVIPRMGSGVIG
jgi:putative CocE/NonD family hydrolase